MRSLSNGFRQSWHRRAQGKVEYVRRIEISVVRIGANTAMHHRVLNYSGTLITITASVLSLLNVGCATPYQKVGFTGGYSETRLDEHVFRVNFRGNGYTSAERAADFCILRGAELVMAHRCRYFSILEGGDSVSYSTYTTPSTSYTSGSASVYGNTAYGSATTHTYGGQTHLISKPRSTLVIRCQREKPESQDAGLVLDARFITSSIRNKYDMPIAGQDETPGESPDEDDDPADAAPPPS